MKIKNSLKKIPYLKFFYHKYSFLIRKLSKPQKSVFGFYFTGNKNMRKGKFEKRETKIIDYLLDECEVFIDIGANIGYYCCFALQKKKYTIAFEPLKSNLYFLNKNLTANDFSNFEIFPIALGNKIGLIDFFGENTGASIIKGWADSKNYNKRKVPINTLNNVLGNRFEKKNILILIDVEGAENYLLEEAYLLLNQNPKPIWFIEINIDEHQPEGIKINPHLKDIFNNFFSKGYVALAIDEHLTNITIKDIEIIEREKYNHIKTHNFLFVDKNNRNNIELLKL